MADSRSDRATPAPASDPPVAWREVRAIRGDPATLLVGPAERRVAWREVRAMRGDCATTPIDGAVAQLARDQHGVVSRRRLRGLGLSDDAIDRRVAAGRLHRLHRGVYAVGHTRLTGHGRWMAAVLACGDGAALFGASAAALWGIRRSNAARIDVVVPTDAGRAPRRGIRLHRIRTLTRLEVTTCEGIRVTTPARTILDLAATLNADALHRALDRTEILQLTDYPALDAIARAHPGHRGARRLRTAVATYLAGAMTRSDLEDLFLAICRRHDLPRPAVNGDVGGFEVDVLFAQQRLIVEIDSRRYHKTRRAFDADRARDARHLQSGSRTVRFTDRRLEHDPHAVAATLHALLARS
jgi:very-short-patch-repair endonuclease